MLGIVMISWISIAQGANLSEICNHPPMFLSDVLCESVMIALFHLFMSNDVHLCFKWESWSSKMKSCDVIHREADLCYIICSSHGWGSGRPLQPLHQNEYSIQIFRQPLHRRSLPRACQGEAGRRGSRVCQASPEDTKVKAEGDRLPSLLTMGRETSIGEGAHIQRDKGIFKGFLKMLKPLESQGVCFT